ncbi:MAG: hypothetical protein AAF721_22565 [Myxococcota bacterium]
MIWPGPYFAFWDAHEGDPLEQQVEAFVRDVVPAHPELYTADVIGLDPSQPHEAALRARLTMMLPKIAARIDEVRATHRELRRDLAQYERSFLASFDDFRYEGRVIVLGAVGGFDGATRTIDGELALLFGVDGMTLYHPEGTNPAPFFHHELFHIYHQQRLAPAGIDLDADPTIAMALWIEGLAVYVSRELNEGATPEDMLLNPAMIAETQARLPELTAELRAKARSTDEAAYADFFLGNGSGRVPERCGYYVGLLVAERLGETRDLETLAGMHGETLVGEIEAALRELGEASSPSD